MKLTISTWASAASVQWVTSLCQHSLAGRPRTAASWTGAAASGADRRLRPRHLGPPVGVTCFTIEVRERYRLDLTV